MRVKVQAKFPSANPNELDQPSPDYPLRLSSFFVSLGVHGLAIAALVTIAGLPGAQPDRPIYTELIKPNERKILIYDFRRKVPDVAPLKKVGASKDPRGAELSKQVIVATSKIPKSKEVFISVPAPKFEVHQDMPAQLLIAQLDTTLSSLPTKPKPKNFVPPPAAKRDPALPMPTPVIEAPAPTVASGASPLPVPETAFSAASTLPRNVPEAPVAHTGNARADIAVASLHPSPDANTPLPNGERPASFSKAPALGPASSGEGNGTLTVPDLTVRQPRPEPVPPPPPSLPRREFLYADRLRGVPLSTLSVPLRPANRMIPPNVDARFRGRNVYIIVIPIEHMPAYGGDWIMWFADRESKPGETPVVRAPIPFRKLEVVDQNPPANVSGARIQLAATLGKNGKLAGVTLLTQGSPATARAVLEDVTAWEFHPASRDGVPVEVDVVLEIPFRLPVSVATNPR
jgi:hypothetical protein